MMTQITAHRALNEKSQVDTHIYLSPGKTTTCKLMLTDQHYLSLRCGSQALREAAWQNCEVHFLKPNRLGSK